MSTINWRIPDENDIVHLVGRASKEDITTLKRHLEYHKAICFTGSGEPYTLYKPHAEATAQVQTACGRWLWLVPHGTEKRKATCLFCLAA